MAEVQAVDRALFGGAPEDVPAGYAEASPMTYVASVRAPVFITAADNDPRCPIEQIETYVAALRKQQVPTKFIRMHLGRGTCTAEHPIAQMGQELAFCRSRIGL